MFISSKNISLFYLKSMMKIKKLLSILFSISALFIMTAYAGENRLANDNSFAGFDVYTFSSGDKDATYYLIVFIRFPPKIHRFHRLKYHLKNF